MFILAETITPPPRSQVFNDHDRQDAAAAKRAEDERWIKPFVEALLGRLKRICNRT
jgi:hypothetical protein